MAKKTVEEIVIDFFKDRYGLLMAQTLFRQYLKKNKIKNFEALEMMDKISFGQMIIEKMYEKFYTSDKIMNLKVLFLLRFSLNQAIEKVEMMLNSNSDVELSPLMKMNNAEMNRIVEEFKKDDIINIGFECTKLIDGLLVLSLNKKKVVEFANTIIMVMMGTEEKSKELNEMKISSIYEFFNILLPDFLKVIGDMFQDEIYFTPIYNDQFMAKYFGEDLIVPQNIMKTNIKITVSETSAQGDVLFFLKSSKASVSDLFSMGGSKAEDPFEQDPPKILVKVTGERRKDMENFFKLLGLRPEDIDVILQGVDNKNLDYFDYHDFVVFCQRLITTFYSKASENKKSTIKANIGVILGIRTVGSSE